jgi:hypothetical protein
MSLDAALDAAYVDRIHPALVASGCKPIRMIPQFRNDFIAALHEGRGKAQEHATNLIS